MRRFSWVLHLGLVVGLWFAIIEAFAEENRGVSWILQMCSEHTDCSAIEDAYKGAEFLNAGWMYLTSNPDRCKCAPKFLKDPRPKSIRIDICNSTCFPERGRVCQQHECFAGMNSGSASKAIMSNDPKVFARIDKSIALAKSDIDQAKGLLDIAVKFCLECTLTTEARIKGNEYVRDKFFKIYGDKYPGMRFVDNPLNDKCITKLSMGQTPYLCEKHGSPKGGINIISDNDGLDYDAIDQLKYWKKNRQSYLTLAWKLCNNGLAKDEGFKPPQNRKNYCGSSRDARDFSSFTVSKALPVSSLVQEIDKKGCKRFMKAPDGPKGFVFKLGDGRSYGVFLSPAVVSKEVFKSVVLRKGGKVIDESSKQPGFRYGVPYEHDPANAKRRVYDFRKHPNTYPDNSVLKADGICWVLEKPKFRVD